MYNCLDQAYSRDYATLPVLIVSYDKLHTIQGACVYYTEYPCTVRRTKLSIPPSRPITFISTMPPSVSPRIASITRNTKETKIQLTLSLDGGPLDFLDENRHFLGYKSIPNQDEETHASQITASQHIWIWTGIGFLDHMLHAWAKHAGWSLRLRSRGDLMSLSPFSL